MGGKPFPDVDVNRRRLMASIGQVSTLPEMLVRRALHKKGLRFRLHRGDMPGTPDIVLVSRRIAIFVHGCFWHRHQCRAGRIPKTRTEYWAAKFARNVERDTRAAAALEAMGWKVVVIWECVAKTPDALNEIVQRLADTPTSDKMRTLGS